MAIDVHILRERCAHTLPFICRHHLEDVSILSQWKRLYLLPYAIIHVNMQENMYTQGSQEGRLAIRL